MLGKLMGVALGRAETKRGNATERGFMEQQYQNQRSLNQQGHDLQMDMWNKTNYGEQLQHMKDAGLNPALMYGMGGGGGATTGSQGGGSAAKGNAQKQMGIEGLMAAAQTELINAQKKNVDADTKNKIDENPNISKRGNEIDMNVLKGSTSIKSLEQNIEESKAKIDKLKNENKLLEGGYESQIKILKNEAISTGIDIAFKNQNIKESKQRIDESKARITKMVQDVVIAKDQVEVNKLMAQIKADYPSLWNVVGKSIQDMVDSIRRRFGVESYRSD